MWVGVNFMARHPSDLVVVRVVVSLTSPRTRLVTPNVLFYYRRRCEILVNGLVSGQCGPRPPDCDMSQVKGLDVQEVTSGGQDETDQPLLVTPLHHRRNGAVGVRGLRDRKSVV